MKRMCFFDADFLEGVRKMAKTYNRLELDVNKKPNSIITEVQGDSNSRYLDVSLFNNGVPLD